jgi:RNA polymerase sigma-70 factor (ECF subfamily)
MELSVPEQDSEDHLVQQAIQRDRTAFTALYDRHVDQVYRHVYYKVSNQADAEDITQEAFVKAWKAIHKYKRTEAPFVAWLITIARNLIADHYKRRPNLVNLDELVEQAPPQPLSDPERLAEVSFNRDVVKQAVLKLEGDKQKVIMMRFIDGFSYEEIALALNKSEGAIRVIQYRALNELRRWVKREQ